MFVKVEFGAKLTASGFAHMHIPSGKNLRGRGRDVRGGWELCRVYYRVIADKTKESRANAINKEECGVGAAPPG